MNESKEQNEERQQLDAEYRALIVKKAAGTISRRERFSLYMHEFCRILFIGFPK